eukprot:scaffold132185_cov61-Cyclotella_meneghiniana.AAC.1
MDPPKVKSEGNANVTAHSGNEGSGNPPAPSDKNKHPALLNRRDFDFLGDSCQLKYPFELIGYEKIFFKRNKFSFEELRSILFPLAHLPPWSNHETRIGQIVNEVHKLLAHAHSSHFQNQNTLQELIRFRRQLRISYYRNLRLPDNIPKHDREWYIEQYTALQEKWEEDPDQYHGVENIEEDDFIQRKHEEKMHVFICQDSYEVLKIIYMAETPAEEDIPYNIGISQPPLMLDLMSFEEKYVKRALPEVVQVGVSGPTSSNNDNGGEEESSDSSVQFLPRPVDIEKVLSNPIYPPIIPKKFDVRDLVKDFPRLTSSEVKERAGSIEMGLIMFVDNIELSDGDKDLIYYIDGGNRLTRGREYLRGKGFLRKREPKGEPITSRTQRWNNFRGLEGLGIDDKFPTKLRECPMFGNYSLAPPMTHLAEVRMVKFANVLFISQPQDENMKCNRHPGGCGWDLAENDICRVDAGECQLIKGRIWNVAVRALYDADEKGNIQLGCKVGIVRVLYNQLHLVANRTGTITMLCHGPNKKSSTINLQNMCGGTARLVFYN